MTFGSHRITLTGPLVVHLLLRLVRSARDRAIASAEYPLIGLAQVVTVRTALTIYPE